MRKSLLLLAVVGLAATAAGSGAASGAPVQIAGHVESDFGLTVTDPEEMLRITAESIAGASPELDAAEARRILDHQLQVDRLIELFLERYPEQYAGAYGEGLGETSVIMVKGMPLGAMQSLVDSYEGVTLRGGAQFSREELIDLTRSLWQVYDDAGHVVSAQMSVRDQRVIIKVATSSATNLIALDAALARAEELMPPGPVSYSRSDVSVELVAAEELEVIETWAYGGDRLQNGAALKCTSAFSVKRNGLSKWGILTAEHCTGIAEAHGYRHIGGNTHNTKRRFGYKGVFGDYMYRSTNGTERDDFYFNDTQKADVASVLPFSQIGVNDWFCRYGRKTGGTNKCAQVNDVLFIDSGGVGGTRTDSTGLDGGDSGGPWYLGSVAVGITHGFVASNLDDVFSSVEIAEDILNVSVMTS